MRQTLLATVFTLFAVPALACPTVLDEGPDQVVMNQAGAVYTIRDDQIRSGADALRAADLVDKLNDKLRRVVLWHTLDEDDPDKGEDPGLIFGERMYWCDVDGTPTPRVLQPEALCSQSRYFRSAVVRRDSSDGLDGSYVLTCSAAEDCDANPDQIMCP
jgi:hypothetical protein